MKYGNIFLPTIFLSILHLNSESLEQEIIIPKNITKDWNSSHKRKIKNRKEYFHKHFFKTSKKNIEKFNKKQKKDSEIQFKNKQKRDQLEKSHRCIANVHQRKAEQLQEKIMLQRKELEQIKKLIKTFQKQEYLRLHNTSKKIKEKALLEARHAQTKEEKKEKDYYCSRIHNTIEHPKITQLKQKALDMRFALKINMQELRSLKGAAYHHHCQGNNYDHIKKIERNLRDTKIIEGKLFKRTRPNLNESKEEWVHKQKIEKLRKRAKMQKQNKKQKQLQALKKETLLKRKNKHKKPHLHIVIQKQLQ